RPFADRLANGADRLREIVDRMMRRHIARLEMNFGGAAPVSGDEAVQNLGEETPLFRLKPTHDAAIDRDQIALGIDEQIAGVHVGMEEAVTQRLAEKGLDDDAREAGKIVP